SDWLIVPTQTRRGPVMDDDEIPYNDLLEDALRWVIEQSLLIVVECERLPGGHYFNITFLTKMPGVRIPDHLAEKYPRELTIVLQHQFYGLSLDESGFEVTLSFDDQAERLYVPISAITVFADPSKNIALTFN